MSNGEPEALPTGARTARTDGAAMPAGGPAPEETGGPAPEETGGPAPEETGGPVPDEASGPVPDEAGPGVPVVDRVRRQVDALDGLEHQPLTEHAERYDQVHAELQAALTGIDGHGTDQGSGRRADQGSDPAQGGGPTGEQSGG